MPNKEALIATARAIDTSQIPYLGFNMAAYTASDGQYQDRTARHCNTTACNAGWAVAVHAPHLWAKRGTHYNEIADKAQAILGLSDDQADVAFMGCPSERALLSDVSPDEAISFLLHLANTGKADWDEALDARPPRPWTSGALVFCATRAEAQAAARKTRGAHVLTSGKGIPAARRALEDGATVYAVASSTSLGWAVPANTAVTFSIEYVRRLLDAPELRSEFEQAAARGHRADLVKKAEG